MPKFFEKVVLSEPVRVWLLLVYLLVMSMVAMFVLRDDFLAILILGSGTLGIVVRRIVDKHSA